MNETDLHQVLERATDAIDSPALAAGALDVALRRRVRVRGSVGVGAVALVVAAVVVGLQVAGSERTQPPLVTPPRTTETATPDAPLIDPDVVAPAWDPATVPSLPLDPHLALPQVLDPPANAPALENAPLGSAVAAMDTGDAVGFVSTDGSWRTVDHPEPALEPAYVRDTVAISAGGDVLVFAGRTRLWWLDVREGEWRDVPYPQEMDLQAEWDMRLVLRTSATVEISGYAMVERRSRLRTWAVELSTGTAELVPYLLDNTGFRGETTVRLDVVEGRRVLFQWTGTTLHRSLFVDAFHSLLYPVVGETSVAAAREVSSFHEPREVTEWDGLIAFDLVGGRTRAYLPVRDENAWYSRGGLMPVAWVSDDVAVIRVIPKDSGGYEAGTAYLATWNVETGALARVSSYEVTAGLVLAPDILLRP
ncbi:MAG: hypothetical protein M3237_02785 [Actinomycetota bacterium]|nr:hypothetical protein [Actinomycetota bacterium]